MNINRPQPRLPIPSNSTKVFDGVIFEIYQWEQVQFDGTIRKFEKAKRKVDSVNVIPITKEGKIILSKQSQPGLEEFIGCLGGRMEPGEEPVDAAKRELFEESGIKAKKFELLFSIQPIEKVDWAVYNFVAKDLEYTKHENEESYGEKIELVEYTYDELLELITTDKLRDAELGYWILQNELSKTNIKEIFTSNT